MTDPMPWNRWIAYRKPNPRAAVRLFCFHYAGGAASVFRGWQDALPREIEICPVQLPGRESRLRESRYERLGPLLDELAGVLPPLFDRPFSFFGHSMGAIVAFELALRLRREGLEQPLSLMVSGRRSPHSPDPDRPIHDLPEEEFRQELRALNGTPEEVLSHPELMELLTPVIRADFAVCETYRHRPAEPLAVPLVAFGGIGDRKVPRESLEGWQRYTTGDFRVRLFQGDHFFLNGAARQDLLRCVAEEVLPRLARLESRPV